MIPWWLSSLAGFILASIIGITAHNLRVDEITLKNEKDKQAQIQADTKECDNSKQPTREADNVSETNNAHLLDQCLSKLRQPTKCIPIIARPTRSVKTTSQQPAGGIDSSAIDASNISCQKDRDDLNTAKIWAIGYDKYKLNLK